MPTRNNDSEVGSYADYKERKEEYWRKTFFIELKDSSLKPADKRRFLTKLLNEIS